MTMWNREGIESLLDRNDKAVLRALVVLYEAQTKDEQRASTVRHLNHRGFSVRTVGRGSYMARRVLAGQGLAPGELAVARKLTKLHSQQLVQIANSNAQARVL